MSRANENGKSLQKMTFSLGLDNRTEPPKGKMISERHELWVISDRSEWRQIPCGIVKR